MVLALIVLLAAGFAVMKLTEVQRAERSFVITMESLKEGNMTRASEYVKGGELISEDLASKYKGYEVLLENLFSDVSYNINSAQKTDSKTIKLNVDITSPDMKSILTSSARDILAMRFKNAFTFGEDKMNENEINIETMNIIIEKMNSNKDKTVTSNVDINIVNTDKGWKIDAVDSVKDAITGGLISGIKDLTKVLG